jgi:protein SCO1/2/putative membrane protein
MKERLLWGVFVVVVACAVAAIIGLWLRRAGDLRPVPEFTLVERSGRPLERKDLRGRVWVAEFIFTRCAGACPVMVSRMYGLHKKFPGVAYVSFTVDPEHDTPEVLADYARRMSLPPDWLFATGTYAQMQDLAKNGFQLTMDPGGDPREPIIHSDRFALVDPAGRIRGTYPAGDAEAMARLEKELARLLGMQKIPGVNAGFNALSAVLLMAGLCFIKAKRVAAHKGCMLAALVSSALFLVGYLTAHHYLGSTPYPGEGWMRPVYFSILTSHTILAALIVPLVGMTVVRAFRGQFDRHRALARWTFPLWLYVSVTGVVIYFLLY